MTSQHRRTSSAERAPLETILQSSGQPAAASSAHVGNAPNRSYFAMCPPPRPQTKHSRASSHNPRPNRLSVSFPVAPSRSSNEAERSTPITASMPSFPQTPTQLTPAPSPSDPSGFLVALASQERRVLELREELRKAEDDLHKLKRQWVNHEAHKKKAETRQMEPLQSMQTVFVGGTEADPPTVTSRRSAEVDRRRAVLSNLNIPKENRRKFSGAHTRALSLLSPERSNFKEPSPLSTNVETNGPLTETPMLDTSQGLSKLTAARARHSYHQGGLGHGAKQIAEDLKSGLWTFMEDLRQATVGDEAINGVLARSSTDIPTRTPGRSASKGSISNNEKSRAVRSPQDSASRTLDLLTGGNYEDDARDNQWSEIEPQKTKAGSTMTPAKKLGRSLSLAAAPIADDLDDDWSNWDSPTPKSPARWSGSTNMSGPATPSSGIGADGEVKIAGQSTDENDTPPKRDEIQWPALDKLSPSVLKGNLQRTMSTIMKEWEKSITPPPEENNRGTAVRARVRRGEGGAEGDSAMAKASTQEDLLMMSP